MKSFAYTAVDAAGRTITGTVSATDRIAAQELLAARGCTSSEISALVAASEVVPHLSESDGLELASYISQLAVVGLPMTGAMSAMAKDLPPGRLPQALRALSDKVESGQSLESSLESLSSRLPPHVRNLMIASARSKQLPQVLEQVLAHERIMDDLSAKLRQAVVYPVFLLGFLVLWLLFVSMWMVPQMQLASLFEDFSGPLSSNNQARIPTSTKALMDFSTMAPPAICLLFGGALILVAATGLIGGRALISRLCAHLPLLGVAWWYRGLVEFSGLLALFVRQQLPLGESLRLVGLSARDPAVRAACSRCAEQMTDGHSLSRSLADQPLFPATFVNLVEWGESHGALAEALDSGRQMFADRFELQVQLVRFILPPIVFVIITGSAFLTAYGFLAYVPKLILDLS